MLKTIYIYHHILYGLFSKWSQCFSKKTKKDRRHTLPGNFLFLWGFSKRFCLETQDLERGAYTASYLQTPNMSPADGNRLAAWTARLTLPVWIAVNAHTFRPFSFNYEIELFLQFQLNNLFKKNHIWKTFGYIKHHLSWWCGFLYPTGSWCMLFPKVVLVTSRPRNSSLFLAAAGLGFVMSWKFHLLVNPLCRYDVTRLRRRNHNFTKTKIIGLIMITEDCWEDCYFLITIIGKGLYIIVC